MKKTITATVKYKEYKERYEGFEKKKENYNEETKEIDITINENLYNRLQDRPYAGIILNEIIGLIHPRLGTAKKYVLAKAKETEIFYSKNEEVLKEHGMAEGLLMAIETMKEWEEAENNL